MSATSERADALSCPLCSASLPRFLYGIHSGGSIHRCGGCGLAFRAEREFLAAEAQHLSQGYHFDLDMREYDRVHVPLFTEYLGRLPGGLSRGVLRRQALLDLGCARGTLLRTAEALGYGRLLGIEPSLHDLEELRRRHPRWELFDRPLSESPIPDASVDAITAIDVLEHLPDPAGDLRAACRILRPGGALLLVTGNWDSDCAQAHGAEWEYFYTAGHINFFSPATLERALRESGFASVRIQCSLDGLTGRFTAPISELEYRARMQRKPPPGSGSSAYFNEFDAALARPGLKRRLKLGLKLAVHKLARNLARPAYRRGNGMLVVARRASSRQLGA